MARPSLEMGSRKRRPDSGEEKKKKESGAGRRVRLVEMGWGVWLLKGESKRLRLKS